MSLPVNPIGVYWAYYAPVMRITSIPTTYNVIFLFQADPVGGTPGSTGAVSFTYPTIGGGSSADIATCTARGQRVILSIGGAGAQLTLGSKARADALYDSIVSINNTLAGSDTGSTPYISGVDWNIFEGTVADGPWMTYVALRLKDKYGADFLMTSPVASSTAQLATDRAAMVEMYQGNTVASAGSTGQYTGTYVGHALDWVCPQFYDDASLTTDSLVQLRLGSTSSGFKYPVTVNGTSTALPNSGVVGIGYSIGVGTSNWTTGEAASDYDDAVSLGLAPKGAFNFDVSEDPTSTFATAMSSHITNNASVVPFTLASSSQFTNGASTTARLTAPSGKTSGADFQAGSINESSNPAASLDLSSGKYTEIEFNIVATSDATLGGVYNFRITDNGTVLDTYSVTPTWTIGSPPVLPHNSAGIGSMKGISSIQI